MRIAAIAAEIIASAPIIFAKKRPRLSSRREFFTKHRLFLFRAQDFWQRTNHLSLNSKNFSRKSGYIRPRTRNG